MVRFFSLATLALVAICFAIGASLALADNAPPAPAEAAPAPAAPAPIEAIEPDNRMFDHSLAAVEDVYEFDFVVNARDEENPEFIRHSDILEI